ncbi:IclR family transcriptional regulator C-terminal domain-containing protein [Paraburkholderia silviterrae]|uniref:IclR family transcriptional regulator n=1 Tax=Paraburkholderia silviterrae TaxID=2528715 RepID=A0A4V2ZYK7_9BURK|nr:IclR family transcriptional regulator C-terminal domain-containing protein [Paraburkholderia silviterrae]TDG20930.1 IclR family transcriptional regulator [Paraburkholderia silviterrae]
MAADASEKETQESEPEYVMGLEKGLSIIEAFGMKRGPLTVTQAAEITGHTKGSVRRSLLTLCRLGYAAQHGYTFVLAPRALRLGYAYVVSDPLTKVAQPILEITSERTQESASIAVLDAQDAVFVARSTHRRSLSSGLGVGSRLPAYCSATGRVLLSGQPAAEVRFMLNRMARPALTPHTLTTTARIMKEIEFVGKHGYAIIDEELEIGVRSIAVPIRNARGEMVAAMSLSVSTSRMTREGVVEHLLPELESARRHLAALL